jgi:hypothetical protein
MQISDDVTYLSAKFKGKPSSCIGVNTVAIGALLPTAGAGAEILGN